MDIKIDMNDVSVLYLKMEGVKEPFSPLPSLKIHSERASLACNNVFY